MAILPAPGQVDPPTELYNRDLSRICNEQPQGSHHREVGALLNASGHQDDLCLWKMIVSVQVTEQIQRRQEETINFVI